MSLEIRIKFGLDNKDAPMFEFLNGERRTVYFYPERETELRERLKEIGLKDWEIEKAVQVVKTFSEFRGGKLKGYDAIVFSYGRCPFCGSNVDIDDSGMTKCELCGTTFYYEVDENGLLGGIYHD